MNIIPYLKMRKKMTDGVIITFVQITARIRDLKSQEKSIAEHAILLDTISHDLKNPLTSLVVSMELFLSTSPDDKKNFIMLHKAAST